MKKNLVMQKIAGETQAKMKNKSKSLPILMNRAQLAAETNFPLRKLYRADISPDALDTKGAPLFSVSRLPEISRILRTQFNREVIA